MHVRSADGAGRLERALAEARTVALDCEAAGFHRYSDRLCLVQLSTPSETFVVDPFAFDPAPVLKPHLEDPGRRVIMHGAAYDLRLLARDLGIRVRSLADTQVAASLLGEPAVGLQALLDRHLGVRVSKKYQRADWAARPLSRPMIEYAAGDTRYLHRLIALLEARLAGTGRLHWAQEEYARLVDAVGDGVGRAASADGKATAGNLGAPAVDPVTRFKGAHRMDDRSVTLLRELLLWRDGIARALDRAPFRVVGDSALAEVVAERPRTPESLARVKGFPPRLARSRGASLIAIMGRVASLPDSELVPHPPPPRRRRRPTQEELAAFDRLKEARNRAGRRLGLEPGRVMPNHVLRRIVLAAPGTRRDLEDLDDVRRWQADAIGDDLIRALRG